MKTYKQKSHSGAKKRFSFSKNNKVKFAHANKSHILTKKTTKRKRSLRQPGYVANCNAAVIKKMISI